MTNRHPPPLMAWLMTLLASSFFFFEFIQMNMFSTLSKYLGQQFEMDAMQIGLLSSSYFIADTLLVYPAGFWTDRFSARRMIAVGMSLCVLGLFLTASATSLTALFIGRFIAGGASAFCLLSILRLASGWFPMHKMAQVTGVVVTIGMLGGMVSQAPLNMLIEHIGWQEALYYLAWLGVGLVVLMVLLVRDAPHQNYAILQREDKVPFWTSLKQMAGSPINWSVGFYIGLMNAPIAVLAGLYGIGFLTGVHGFTAQEAATASGMIFLGMIIGSSVLGFLSDGLRNRKIIMMLSALSAIIIMAMIAYMEQLDFDTSILLFTLLGILSGAQVIGYPVVRESNERHLVGSALGFVSIIIMGLPIILQPLAGFLINWHATGQQVDGIMVYTRQDYTHGLSVITLALIASFIISLVIPETYPKEELHGHTGNAV